MHPHHRRYRPKWTLYLYVVMTAAFDARHCRYHHHRLYRTLRLCVVITTVFGLHHRGETAEMPLTLWHGPGVTTQATQPLPSSLIPAQEQQQHNAAVQCSISIQQSVTSTVEMVPTCSC